MQQNAEQKLVWIDCDPGIDDFIAILMGLAQPSLKIIGISALYGNMTLKGTQKNTLDILKLLGYENQIPVFQGLDKPLLQPDNWISDDFHGKNGIADIKLDPSKQQLVDKNVFHEIYKLIQSQKQKVYIVAIAGLTNIAMLLQLYPSITQNIEELSIMGGCIKRGNVNTSAEFNFWCDPPSAQFVLQSGLKIFLNPLELSYQVYFDENKINIIKEIQLKNPNNKFIQIVLESMIFYQSSNDKHYNEYKNFPQNTSPLYDPINIYYLVNRNDFDIEEYNVVVESKSQYSNGRSVIDIYKRTGRKPNCFVGMSIKSDGFWDCFYESLQFYIQK